MKKILDEVLIVGAGPTGLVLALWLTKFGIKVRIIDKTAQPGTTSRAMAVQARTLELYQQLDLAKAVEAAGCKNAALNLWVSGKKRARLPLAKVGAKFSPYPFILMYPQDYHEQLLVDKLQTLGITVERQTEFLDFENKGDSVIARILLPNGQEELTQVAYIAGCDGARSPIRHQMDTGFPGGTYSHFFYVADAEASGENANGEINISITKSDFVAWLSYNNHGKGRLIGIINDAREGAENITFNDINSDAIKGLGLTIDKVNWFSTYRVHHRITSHYRLDRVFLLGDAAHVHSPAGGQGMNTGIGDAINFAWKLAAVMKGQAPDSLLDTYEIERRAFATQLVQTTDRVFSFITKDSKLANFMRVRVVPYLMSFLYSLNFVREFAFRTVSQIKINYRHSPISEGKAGKMSAGERLPWVKCAKYNNFDTLKIMSWQVHIYGIPSQELTSWCASNKVPLQIFDWNQESKSAGFTRNAIYLLRPDTYIALIDQTGTPELIDKYFTKHKFSPNLLNKKPD